MQKSKIQQVMQTGQSEWQGKQLTKFTLAMDNGDTGVYTIGFGADDKVPVVGDELEYEVLDKGYGPEIKPAKKAFAGGGGFKKWTPEQVAEQNALKITVAAIEAGLKLKDYKACYTDAYKFFLKPDPAQVKTHMQEAQAMVDHGMPPKPSIQNNQPSETEDDLPF